jgi:hypothetical protein
MSPSLEWANVKYKVTDDFTVRLGRIVLPIFQGSRLILVCTS